MSWFKNLYGKITGMKESTEQQEIINKINETYESISKGIEDLNTKVVNVKELKQKLKNLPPPVPEKPKETSSDEKKTDVEKNIDEKSDKPAPLIAPAPAPAVEPSKPTNVTAPEPAATSSTTSSSSTENNVVAQEKPQEASSSSPLPRPGATEATPMGDFGSLDFDGGKKRKTRAKSKRTIPKNGERKKRQRTRKNKNKDNETMSNSMNNEAVAELT
jgi:hypothetical protein